jgi:predicted small lipoprotein YifL
VILIVKSFIALKLGACAVLTGLLAGCGQPGPLYMPKPPAKPAPVSVSATLPAPSSPAAQ